MLKKLTLIGIVESGLSELVAGKSYAYVAVVNPNHEPDGEPPYRLGVAVANEPGYYPVPIHWAHADDYQAMDRHAHELNDALKLSDSEALHIIASTMRGSFGRRGKVRSAP